MGGGIVGASFAYHAHLNNINEISVITETLPGDKQQATTNTWGWVNGYANNDEEYASFRLANLNYWPKLIENINYEIKDFNSEISVVIINDASSEQIVE